MAVRIALAHKLLVRLTQKHAMRVPNTPMQLDSSESPSPRPSPRKRGEGEEGATFAQAAAMHNSENHLY